MSDEVQLMAPQACSETQTRAFERLVREGFDGSDEGLPDRIRHARCLAFRYTESGELVGIAGLKSPSPRYRAGVFAKAGADVSPDPFAFELGWVYVPPAHRGHGIGEDLCRRLVNRQSGAGLFAMTRPGNAPMMRILDALGFAPSGRPYVRRDHRLVLYVRPDGGHGPTP